MKKLLLGIILGIVAIVSVSIPVFAIGNPDSISFGTGNTTSTYAVFSNVRETGDMLFMAEGFVNYAIIPTDYTADQSFIFEVLNTAGNVTLLSTPLAAYGDRPIGIYQTATQVTSNNLTVGGAYVIRIQGNPLIFSSTTNNTVSATLGAGDYFDNTSLISGSTPTRIFVINIVAAHMQTHDGVVTDGVGGYKETILGAQYLTTTGANLFLAGIPGLDTLDPSIFKAGNQALSIATTSGNGTYGMSLTTQSVWGTTTTNGLIALSNFIGMGNANGGHVALFVIGAILALGLGAKTQSPLLIIIVIALLPLFGALLGMMNLAAAFTISIIIIILGTLLFARSVLT